MSSENMQLQRGWGKNGMSDKSKAFYTAQEEHSLRELCLNWNQQP